MTRLTRKTTQTELTGRVTTLTSDQGNQTDQGDQTRLSVQEMLVHLIIKIDFLQIRMLCQSRQILDIYLCSQNSPPNNRIQLFMPS